jgi:dimethylhistidine N-methyltransferase
MKSTSALRSPALPALETETTSFAEDVRRGFAERPRRVPPRWFYDALGSALFDAITRLPWYPISRSEKRLLAGARPELKVLRGSTARVVEMGCGNGEKLSLVLDAVADGRPLEVALVDVSAEALAASASRALAHPGVTVRTLSATYAEGLARALEGRDRDGRALVLFLGSNLGNFEPEDAADFLHAVRAALRPGDRLLLGAELRTGDPSVVVAYDDPLGVTAAFNRNLLVRMNRELGADFDLAAWDHRAVWNAGANRVEMHLVSRREQHVSIPAAGVSTRVHAGEAIFTEASYKYPLDVLVASLGAVGFVLRIPWVDAETRVALLLFEAA